MLTIEPIYKNNIEPTENWKDDLWLFEKGFNAYYLIDGQQRLTTSIILINEILNTVDSDIFFNTKEYWTKKFLYESHKGDYKSYIFGYEKDNPSDEFFKTRILQQESSSSDKVPESTLYTMNLDNAKKFFEKKLSKLNHDEIENGTKIKIKGKVLQELEEDGSHLLRVSINDDYDKIVLVVISDSHYDRVIAEGDQITLYGLSAGRQSYTTVFNSSKTLPSMVALMYEN